MPNYNVKAPRQTDYDDDQDEVANLKGQVNKLLARLDRLEKTRTTGTTTQTIITGGGGGGTSTPGAPGAPGADGAAATIAIGSTTTLAPGSPAAVTNSGSSNAAVLQFEIPAGENGIDGADGLPPIIQEEGVSLPQRTKLNFVGAGSTATDDAANDRTIVTIPGAVGGGSITVRRNSSGTILSSITQLNFLDNAAGNGLALVVSASATPGEANITLRAGNLNYPVLSGTGSGDTVLTNIGGSGPVFTAGYDDPYEATDTQCVVNNCTITAASNPAIGGKRSQYLYAYNAITVTLAFTGGLGLGSNPAPGVPIATGAKFLRKLYIRNAGYNRPYNDGSPNVNPFSTGSIIVTGFNAWSRANTNASIPTSFTIPRLATIVAGFNGTEWVVLGITDPSTFVTP